METTKLSSKGQVIIPKYIRESYHWDTGLELQVIESAGGVLLKPKAPFKETSIDEVNRRHTTSVLLIYFPWPAYQTPMRPFMEIIERLSAEPPG